MTRFILAAVLAAALGAHAADDRFHKKTPDSMNGFAPARDALYIKECGTCHFAFSPGLLPARSWVRMMGRLDRHFGENVSLDAATRGRLQDYLAKNAADVSAYEGSKTFMERVDANATPRRLWEVPLFKEMHTVMVEVIGTKQKVKVKTLTNCNACHQKAADGSFGNDELYIPGLTGP
jgi:hypothetical protein